MTNARPYLLSAVLICVMATVFMVLTFRQTNAQRTSNQSVTQPFQIGQKLGLLVNYGGKPVDARCKVEDIKGNWIKCTAILPPPPPDPMTGLGSTPYKVDWVNTDSVIAVFPPQD
jgi:hypothetical protein